MIYPWIQILMEYMENLFGIFKLKKRRFRDIKKGKIDKKVMRLR